MVALELCGIRFEWRSNRFCEGYFRIDDIINRRQDMRHETTPDKLTESIIELGKKLKMNVEPVYIPVVPAQGCLINECFPNVESMVQQHGGRQINGWSIWQWANIMVEAEAHSVWENPEGQLVDITPHASGETKILFLKDDNMVYNDNPIPNVRMALTKSELVAEYIALMNERDRIMCESPGKVYSIPKNMHNRMIEIQLMFNLEVKHYEPCPCGSGLKYKKCCGKE